MNIVSLISLLIVACIGAVAYAFNPIWPIPAAFAPLAAVIDPTFAWGTDRPPRRPWVFPAG